MADSSIVHIGENSPEQVAYKLLVEIARAEGKFSATKFTNDRKYILDVYAEALNAVKGHRSLTK